MPLFLSLVAEAAADNPALAAEALAGLKRYQQSPERATHDERPVLARHRGAILRDCGGSGPPLVLVPSLINPPTVLDLDPDCSLAVALSGKHRVLLLDWGSVQERRHLDLGGHVEELLLPLLQECEPAALVGYCLGGTLALAAAARSRCIRAVATLASPWRFDAYPLESRQELLRLWQASQDGAARLQALPMEVLQAAFWQMDPARVVAKFARFAALPEGSPEAIRFVTLEDWANGGEPLPFPAARELVEELFGQGWSMGPLPTCPMLHFTAGNDRIVPAGTVAPGEHIGCQAGHVGMIVGRDAQPRLHAPLLSWLEGVHRSR